MTRPTYRLHALVKLGIVSASIVVILAGSSSVEARAQTDSIGGRIFRDVLTEVAKASDLPRLDSAALPAAFAGRSASTPASG